VVELLRIFPIVAVNQWDFKHFFFNVLRNWSYLIVIRYRLLSERNGTYRTVYGFTTLVKWKNQSTKYFTKLVYHAPVSTLF